MRWIRSAAAVAVITAIAVAGVSLADSSGGNSPKAKSAATKRGPRGKTGKTGPRGPQGPEGPAGPAGAGTGYSTTEADARFLRRTITIINSATVNVGTFGGTTANCPSGYEAIGGGVAPQNVLTMQVTESAPRIDNSDPFVLANGQHSAGTGWIGFAVNNAGVAQTVKVVAVCAAVG
jgi:hypothetical protein